LLDEAAAEIGSDQAYLRTFNCLTKTAIINARTPRKAREGFGFEPTHR